MAPTILSSSLCSCRDHRHRPRGGNRVLEMRPARQETTMENKWDEIDTIEVTTKKGKRFTIQWPPEDARDDNFDWQVAFCFTNYVNVLVFGEPDEDDYKWLEWAADELSKQPELISEE
jgi:hypothetical protein